MQTVGTASAHRFKDSANLSHALLPMEQQRQVRRLKQALQSLDRRLARLGLERNEIARFALDAAARDVPPFFVPHLQHKRIL